MKIIAFSLALLLSFAANCQNKYGFFAGPQVTGVKYKIDGKKQESGIKPGLNMGLQFKTPIEDRLNFAPSLMYNYRGYKVDFSSPSLPPDTTAVNNNTTFHTIELAFLFQYDFEINQKDFFFRIGPSLDFAIFGNEKFQNATGETTDRKMKFSFQDYGYVMGAAILQVGHEATDGFYFYAHYNYGLSSMNNKDNGPKIFNRAAGITIGKYLSKK